MSKWFCLSVLALLLVPSQSSADIVFSTSNTSHTAGTNLSLNVGDSGSMFVWISTNNGQELDAVSLSILSNNADVLEATAHNINNPSNRWFGVAPGVLGDLVTDSNAFTLFGGLSTNGKTDFTLHSEIAFTATSLGQTVLSFAEGKDFMSDGTGVPIWDQFATGTAVVTAVPEPSSALLLTGVVCVAAAYRRRRAC